MSYETELKNILYDVANGKLNPNTAFFEINSLKKGAINKSKINKFVIKHIDEMQSLDYGIKLKSNIINFITNLMQQLNWEWHNTTVTEEMFKNQMIDLLTHVITSCVEQYIENPNNNDIHSDISSGGLHASAFVDTDLAGEHCIDVCIEFILCEWNDCYNINEFINC